MNTVIVIIWWWCPDKDEGYAPFELWDDACFILMLVIIPETHLSQLFRVCIQSLVEALLAAGPLQGICGLVCASFVHLALLPSFWAYPLKVCQIGWGMTVSTTSRLPTGVLFKSKLQGLSAAHPAPSSLYVLVHMSCWGWTWGGVQSGAGRLCASQQGRY